MRYIRNISDDQNKSGDTDNIFRFNLLQGDDVFNFGDYPISINIANSSGYILSMVPEKEFGNSVLKLDFNDQSLKSLTPDNYLLEVEVKFPDGTTATFPTKGGMPFSINSNLKNTAGHLVPIVTFDEVLSAVDKKVNNYLATVVKGDKGDTGVVDTAKDYTWTGTNTFNKKIIAPAGVQGNADTATQLQTARRINGTAFDGTADINVNAANDGSLVHKTGDEIIAGFKKFSGNIATTSDNSMINGGGQNGDIAFVKKSGSSGLISIGSSNWFTVRQSDNTSISPSDTLKDYFVVKPTGVITAGLNQDLVPLDKNVIHNTGTETVAGDKTFTENVSFTKQIDGSTSTKQIPVNDFRDIALNTIKYSGHWFANSVIMDNSPLPGQALYGGIEVIAGYNQFAGIIVYSDYPSWRQAGTYVASIEGSIINWVKISNDATGVHNTGTETIAGDKTFTGSTDIRNQKQYKASFSIGTNTINLTRIGSMVYVNAKTIATINGGNSYGAIPIGFTPANHSVINFILGLEQGSCLFQVTKDVWFPVNVNVDSNMSGSYLTSDAFPS